MNTYIELEKRYSANNYRPQPVVACRGEGVYVWDTDGHRYIDMTSAYSAVNHGHAHPRLIKALTEQAKQLAIVSRAFYTDKLGAFLEKICALTDCERALPMNSGAEATETAIKAVRKWGYEIKKIPEGKAEIIVCTGNFHGRTTTLISCSTVDQYRKGFGPFTPGFRIIPYGDAAALEAAITPNTAAFLVEPIQGEGGIHVPPVGYLKTCAEICQRHRVLLVADEIQTGLGRTGKILACEHEGVKPDAVTLGKSLGGGLLPVSLFLATQEIMDVFTPGDHGSTFGGNALSSAVGLEALNVLLEEHFCERSETLGNYFMECLKAHQHPAIKEVRGKGLFIGVEIDKRHGSAHAFCLNLLKNGLLTKETHETVVRLTPPLIITKEQLDEALAGWKQALAML